MFAQAGNTDLAFGGLSATAAGGLSLVLLCAAFLLLAGKAGKRRIAPRGGMWYNTGRNAGGPGKEGAGALAVRRARGQSGGSVPGRGSPGKEGTGLPGRAL